MLRTLTATRYVTPLREGGSLPAIVEADDDGLYVLKFRGAGQGPKALIAELLAGEIARALGLPVPEIVFAELCSSGTSTSSSSITGPHSTFTTTAPAILNVVAHPSRPLKITFCSRPPAYCQKQTSV